MIRVDQTPGGVRAPHARPQLLHQLGAMRALDVHSRSAAATAAVARGAQTPKGPIPLANSTVYGRQLPHLTPESNSIPQGPETYNVLVTEGSGGRGHRYWAQAALVEVMRTSIITKKGDRRVHPMKVSHENQSRRLKLTPPFIACLSIGSHRCIAVGNSWACDK